MVTQIKTSADQQKVFRYLPGRPIVGHMPDFTKDRLGLLRRMAQEDDVCGIHLGPTPAILFNRPEHIQSILIDHASDFDKGDALHRAFRPPIGDGIFSSEGDFHHHQRKLIAPPFQPRHIASYAESMGHYGEQIQQTWSDGGIVDINQEMSNLTVSIIGKALFDADVFTETGELGVAIKTIFDYIAHALTSLILPPYSWPLPSHRRVHKATEVLHRLFQNFIEDRRLNTSIERNDFLSILLRAKDEDGNPMSDQQVMAECMTLFSAGHETTATALIWVWYFLCQNPEMYQRVQQEVDTVLQGRTPTYADLEHLPYCLQVFKEVMRIYPSAYFFFRRALRDIEIDGYRVSKNEVAMTSPYTMHRREEYFPDPERFDPERFTPEREKQLPRHAYMPFGAGPRVCIGNYFATMEGHLILATLAQRVTFELVPGQSIVPDVEHNLTTRPTGAVNMVVKKR
jgi:cytochrome P450